MIAGLIENLIDPALAAVPVNYAADALAHAAGSWFDRFRESDDLSRVARAAAGKDVSLSRSELRSIRKLLEDPGTWRAVGRSDVGELVTQIASRLALHGERASEEARDTAAVIASGLLEGALAELDPKRFQQVLLSRLRRMEANDTTVLDEAMLGLHADLAARFMVSGQLDAQRFTSLTVSLGQVLDRLPPGPAGRGEVVVYLTTLIDCLTTDRWPDRGGHGGPVLSPAMIERELQVVVRSRQGEACLGADAVARQCHRLVILGGPGSGKTWLAKRTARRCAEEALTALADGAGLDEVELPLFTTCAALAGAAAPPGHIREAAVSAALDQLGDLGGTRVTEALRSRFTERDAVVLIIDSLDEASDAAGPLARADTLPWRIVLTSRPSSWDCQLDIRDSDDAKRVCELQALSYPGDVEALVRGWFDGDPASAADVAAQIARRPSLQRSATVPLLLAFYCVLGGKEPLPDSQHDLHAKVIRRLLTGGWRPADPPDVDRRACLQTLRTWAWTGTRGGDGAWADYIRTERVMLGPASRAALDHVAVPLGPPDLDDELTVRRFIHRSVHEHLVAEYVASLPAEQAARILLPHLWYDPDWEYAASAAIAMHQDCDRLLRILVAEITRPDDEPGRRIGMAARWHFLGLLARVATESRESDWSTEMAGIIGQARVELAIWHRLTSFGGTRSWEVSNRQIRDVLLGRRPDERYYCSEAALGRELILIDPSDEEKHQAREMLLGMLAEKNRSYHFEEIVDGLIRLGLTDRQKRKARGLLARYLGDADSALTAGDLADCLTRLDLTAGERGPTRRALLRSLLRDKYISAIDSWREAPFVQLAPTAEEKEETRQELLGLLDNPANAHAAAVLAATLSSLDPGRADRRRAGTLLLARIRSETSRHAVMLYVTGLIHMATTADDKFRVREDLLGLMAGQTDPFMTMQLASGVVQLAATAGERHHAREALLQLIARQEDSLCAGMLADAVTRLAVTAADKHQTRDALMQQLLSAQMDGGMTAAMAGGISRLTPPDDDKAKVMEVLRSLLPDAIDGHLVCLLARRIADLDPPDGDKQATRSVLVRWLDGQDDDILAESLAGELARLDPTAKEGQRACEMLSALLARETDKHRIIQLAEDLRKFDPGPEERRLASSILVSHISGEFSRGLVYNMTRNHDARELVRAVVQLALTAAEKAQLRGVLLGIIADRNTQLQEEAESRGWQSSPAALALPDPTAREIAEGVVQLAPALTEKIQVRQDILALLAGRPYPSLAAALAEGLAQLNPAVSDLLSLPAGVCPIDDRLLAPARRHSTFDEWIAILPPLIPLPHIVL